MSEVHLLFSMEKDLPFTMNSGYLSRLKDRYSLILEDHLEKNSEFSPKNCISERISENSEIKLENSASMNKQIVCKTKKIFKKLNKE